MGLNRRLRLSRMTHRFDSVLEEQAVGGKIIARGGSAAVRDEVRRAARWMLSTLCGQRLADNISVHIGLRYRLKKREGARGDAEWTDNNIRPRRFFIRLDSTMRRLMRMRVLAHEMIHVSQWASGRMLDMQRAGYSGFTRYDGRMVDTDKVGYRSLPWEIEACAGEKDLAAKCLAALNGGMI